MPFWCYLPVIPSLPRGTGCPWTCMEKWGAPDTVHIRNQSSWLLSHGGHWLAFPALMTEAFCTSFRTALFRSGPCSQCQHVEPVLYVNSAPLHVISWKCSRNGSRLQSWVSVMLLRIKGGICTQARPVFFLSCSYLLCLLLGGILWCNITHTPDPSFLPLVS